MQTIELPLYPTVEPRLKANIVPSVNTISQLPLPNPQVSLENAIDNIFSSQEEESNAVRMRRHLGEIAKSLSDEQIECITTEFQFLIDTWMDEFERDVFSGKTLREALNEG